MNFDYKFEVFWFLKKPTAKMNNRDKLVYRAKLAEQAERYKEMLSGVCLA